MSGPQPGTIELHCACGERRLVPAGLRVVSCVKCGQELGPPLPDPGPRPSIYLLVLAAYSTQLVSGLALCLGIAWAARRGGPSSDAIAWMAAWSIASIVGLLAAGKAHRGSVGAMIVSAVVDAAIVAMRLVGHDYLTELLHVSGAARYVTSNVELLALAIAASAGVACLLCVAALPQVRRYVAWQHGQLELAIRTKRL